MRKVLIFALTILVALGGLGYAHAAVTDSQDELTIFPSMEEGDPSVLAGRTANVTFRCGNYLRWNSDYTFGEETTESTFEFNAKGWPQESGYAAYLDTYCSGGMGASISGGGFSPGLSDYGALLRAVAVITPDGGSKTMNLKLSDYVEFYQPDFELHYEDDTILCQESRSLGGQLTGDAWYEESLCYDDLFRAFRFPVREDDIMSVTVTKDELGNIIEIDLHPENSLDIHFVSDVTAEGVWFLPVFQDEDGTPMAYESPEGHGIYFAPWKKTGSTQRTSSVTKDIVTLDLDALRLVQPMDETPRVSDMVISAEEDRAWMLTVEDSAYVLHTYDLAAGQELCRTAVLPYDGGSEYQYAGFFRDDGFLLIHAQNQVALYEERTDRLLLTAPVDPEQMYAPSWYDPEDGELEFDGEYLTVTEAIAPRDGAFYVNVFAQDREVYYGVYDCSLLRGNDDWYYSSILPDTEPVILK